MCAHEKELEAQDRFDFSLEVSLVLPCYQASSYVNRSLSEAVDLLTSLSSSWEILAVEDGSPDGGATLEVLESASRKDPRIRVLRQERNQGKGAAVRRGFLESRGQYCLFTDADMPYRLEDVGSVILFLREGRCSVVIGDRCLPTSVYHQEIPRIRKILSRVCSCMVGFLVGGFQDTQCGLKGCRGIVAKELASRMTIDRFAFDVEMLYLALSNRLDVRRIPVILRHNEPSTIAIHRTAPSFLVEIFRIVLRRLRGKYRSPALLRYVSESFQEQRAVFKEISEKKRGR
jgi:dolichyl-phosphate beta-glucosyltransferase